MPIEPFPSAVCARPHLLLYINYFNANANCDGVGEILSVPKPQKHTRTITRPIARRIVVVFD